MIIIKKSALGQDFPFRITPVAFPTLNLNKPDKRGSGSIFTPYEIDYKTVKTIPSNDIAKAGGVLNCISWNILNLHSF